MNPVFKYNDEMTSLEPVLFTGAIGRPVSEAFKMQTSVGRPANRWSKNDDLVGKPGNRGWENKWAVAKAVSSWFKIKRYAGRPASGLKNFSERTATLPQAAENFHGLPQPCQEGRLKKETYRNLAISHFEKNILPATLPRTVFQKISLPQGCYWPLIKKEGSRNLAIGPKIFSTTAAMLPGSF